MLDIYFNEDYGKLGEYVEPGKCTVFEYNGQYGKIRHMFIKREVPWKIGGETFYDIITPYGYGGPIVLETQDQTKLVNAFEQAFKAFCFENRIVAEFIRYHPIYRNWEPFNKVYENTYSRHTVGTNLADYEDPVQSEFSKSAKKELRRAINAGVICKVFPQPDDLSTFRRLYEETMNRNHADAMYYFPDDYYQKLTTVLRPYVLIIEAMHEGEVIASELYFTEGEHLHAHLLGSNDKLLELNAGSLLEATAAKWGKENGYRYIHHGGGRTSAEDDSLFLYKKKFGKNTEFDFYTGKKIWDEKMYEILVNKRNEHNDLGDVGFFPEYRR